MFFKPIKKEDKSKPGRNKKVLKEKDIKEESMAISLVSCPNCQYENAALEHGHTYCPSCGYTD